MEKKTYICGDCGCVFEEKNVIVNLKERLGKESFKSLVQNPFNRFSKLIGGRICPECGADNVMEVNETTETALPEYMTAGWDSSLLREYVDMEELKDNPSDSEEKPGIRNFVGKTIGFFKDRINDFKEKYNSSDLMKKIAAVAKKAGVSTVYH
ncbi:MAG: hypothetical protein K2M16_09730, partial [Muribaculaceae bacterium]|nr:hypothetical protein [Muribaculaceae bacterium]